MGGLLEFIKDWNFIVPGILWGGRELSRWARAYRRRSLLWGFRAGRSVVLLREQPSQQQGYLYGEVGSLAVARAGQRVADELRKVGLDVAEASAQDFDPNSTQNMAVVSLLSDEASVAGSMAGLLGVRMSVTGNKFSVDDHAFRPQLTLLDGELRTDTEYAILIRGRNPNRNRHGITIIAALTAQGVESAVKAMVSDSKLSAQLRSRKPGVCLFTLDMSSGIVRTQEIG
ncbi:hypothetical protein [Streptomyces sp. NPDC127038]|uniref:hypothetical protein n=1 Tax=Streptomyces sp. NPDC127038 TaxID=3347114 RepID=UPI003652E889